MPGADPISTASNALGAGLGVYEFLDSASKEKKDKAALDALKQPFYQVQSEFYQNKNIASQQAGQGLPTATRQYETQEAQWGLGAGLDAILRAGGGVNDAALLTQGYNNQIGKIGSQDAEAHMNNLQYFMKANADLAAEKTKQWTINEYQPYEAKLKELKQNIQTDEQNKWAGISGAVGSLSAGGTSQLNSKLFSGGGGGGQRVSDPYSAASGYSAPELASVGGGAPSIAGQAGALSGTASAAAMAPDISSLFSAAAFL